MRGRALLSTILLCSVGVFAGEKPRINIQVVGTEDGQRQYTYTVAGTPAQTTTSCNTDANKTEYNTRNVSDTSISGNTTCTTTSQPATPPTTQVRSVKQEDVHAVMPKGEHVTLWCQAGLRRCDSLPAGSYSAEVKGNTVWIYVADLDGTEHKVKYKAAGTW